MKSLLEHRLDLILETDTTSVADDPYQSAQDIAIQLEEARRKVTELERNLMFAMNRIAGGIALGIKKDQPGLNVGVGDGCCRVGYKSQNMSIKPDLVKRVLVIKSPNPDLENRAIQSVGNATAPFDPTPVPVPPAAHPHDKHVSMSPDLGMIAKAITAMFTSHIAGMGESIVGRGVIVLEGRNVGVGELATFVKHCDKMLIEHHKPKARRSKSR